MLPMGTIVAVCMIIGLVFAARLPLLGSLPRPVSLIVGVVVLAAGLWNALWYGLQHITEFWGYNALLSGILMIICAGYILAPDRMPDWLNRLRPLVLVLLLCFALLYAITIYRL